MDRVYGEGELPAFPDGMALPPFIEMTVKTLFGKVWSDPNLSVRDRRLLTMGATAQLGRADLVDIQVMGALIACEMTEVQLQETVLHLAFYCGWPNATLCTKEYSRLSRDFRRVPGNKFSDELNLRHSRVKLFLCRACDDRQQSTLPVSQNDESAKLRAPLV